jgi:hypothetical protein
MGVELVCRTRLRRPRHLQALHPTTGLLLGQQNRYALEESPQEAT